MDDVGRFAVLIGLVAVAGLAAVLANRMSLRLRVPAPALFLIGAAVASDLVPALGSLDIVTVQRIVTIALVAILFDGGMHIGVRRFRAMAGPILWIGVAGTLVTAAAVAGVCHLVFGLDPLTSMLIGTAVAPTDPAVVFSVLGKREVAGSSGVLLEGESGANDPVGIALLAGVLAAASTGGGLWVGVREFALQLGIGAVVGVLLGLLLNAFVRRVRLPTEGLYPLRTLTAAFLIYAVATVLHGSGFLAVFVAGILLGDVRAPYHREIRRFHTSLASLGEIVAFTVLGLTVSLRALDASVLAIGGSLAVLLAFVLRPLFVGPLLLPVRLAWGERIFVMVSGLKGAVPILLGTFVLTAAVADAQRIYAIIFLVVAFSVIVQGGLVPPVAGWCRVPMRIVEPRGTRRFVVTPGSRACGTTIREITQGGDFWFSAVSRSGSPLRVRPRTVLEAGDEVTVMVDTEAGADPASVFTSEVGSPAA